MRLLPFALITVLTLLAGCATATSPVASMPAAGSQVTLGEAAELGAGGAAGALIGDKLGGGTGALIGGAAGLAGAALIHNAVASSGDQKTAEVVEQARRQERLKIMQDYWLDHTLSAGRETSGQAGNAPLLEYPAGTYSGILFAPRLAADPTLTEPIR
jgi:hypothetical protein